MRESRPSVYGEDGRIMTPWQIWLKRLCMLMLIWACLEVLGSALTFVLPVVLTQASPSALFNGAQEVPVSLLGLTALFGAIFDIFVGFIGIRGAKNPQKIALFFWISLIDAVLTSWALASSISMGGVELTSLISSAFIIILAVCAWKVRGQTGYFDKHPMPEES